MDTIDKISALIQQKDKTQSAFAKNFNNPKVTKQTVTDWKSGKSKSYFSMIRELSEYFGVSMDYLIGDSNSDSLISDDEQELLSEFRKLDFKGKSAVMQTILNEQKRIEYQKNQAGDTTA